MGGRARRAPQDGRGLRRRRPPAADGSTRGPSRGPARRLPDRRLVPRPAQPAPRSLAGAPPGPGRPLRSGGDRAARRDRRHDAAAHGRRLPRPAGDGDRPADRGVARRVRVANPAADRPRRRPRDALHGGPGHPPARRHAVGLRAAAHLAAAPSRRPQLRQPRGERVRGGRSRVPARAHRPDRAGGRQRAPPRGRGAARSTSSSGSAIASGCCSR